MTDAPPRGREERLRDTRAKLDSDVDLWVATSGSPGGVHLIPLSYLWDGTAFLISTPRASITGRNLLADGRVRLSLGPTRDVVLVDGTARPVDIADLAPETGDAFATRTGFDPREFDERYQYFRIRPRRIQAWRRRTSCEDATSCATAAGSADRRTGTPAAPASGVPPVGAICSHLCFGSPGHPGLQPTERMERRAVAWWHRRLYQR